MPVSRCAQPKYAGHGDEVHLEGGDDLQTVVGSADHLDTQPQVPRRGRRPMGEIHRREQPAVPAGR